MCTERLIILNYANSQVQKEIVEYFFALFGINRHQNFQFDLNHRSLINEGLCKKYNKPVRLIVETILKNLNDGIYQELLIQELPEFFCQENIKIEDFLTKSVADEQEDDDESKDRIENCNFETKLRDSTLPFLGKPNTHYFEHKYFNNIYDLRGELEAKVKHDQVKEKKGESLIWNSFYTKKDTSNTVEVGHSVINFFPIIRQTKIALYQGWGQEHVYMKKVRQQFAQHPADFNLFNDVLLADLILNQKANKEFFECTAINTLIDRQYQKTIDIYWFLLLLYFFTFIVPFTITLVFYNEYHEEDQIANNTRMLLSCICLISNISFWLLEFVQIDYIARTENGTWDRKLIWDEYFEGWNITDFLQPFVYLAHKIIFFTFDLESYPLARLAYQITTIIQMTFSFDKIMQYMRYHTKFTFLVNMFYMVFNDLREFLTLIFIMVLAFSFMLTVVGGEVDGGDYYGFPGILATIVQMSRNSIGDLAVLKIGKWQIDWDDSDELPSFAQYAAIFIIWGIWFVDLFIMVIVMLNFLIAEVSQTYEKVMTEGGQFLYKSKADCNLLTIQMEEYYNQIFLGQKPGEGGYQALLFRSAAKLNTEEAESDIAGFTSIIKKDAKNLLFRQKAELLKYIQQTDGVIQAAKAGALRLLQTSIHTLIRNQQKTEESLNQYVEEQMEVMTKRTDQYIERVQKVNADLDRLDECKSTMNKILQNI